MTNSNTLFIKLQSLTVSPTQRICLAGLPTTNALGATLFITTILTTIGLLKFDFYNYKLNLKKLN